jgi:septum formation protein
MSIVLASKSAARRAVLTGAGVPFEVAVAGVDEDAVKAAMLAQGASPRDVADALAEIKAVKISASRPGFVIGSDQTLEFEGKLYDKAETLEAAAERLKAMRASRTSCTRRWWWPRTARRSGARSSRRP